MIVLIGSVLIKEGLMVEAKKLSLEHVRRARAEPGCISHDVHLDCENPNLLFFVEEWIDIVALQAHFQVPASRQFAADLSALALKAPKMKIYQAARIAV